MSEELYTQMAQAVIDGEDELAAELAQKGIDAGLRDGVKVMIGGAPTTRAWSDEIGADGYAEDAIEAVAVAKQLMGVA